MKKFLFFIIIFFLFNTTTKVSAIGNPEIGKDLFKKNCTACHSIDLKKKMIGPPLSGIMEKRKSDWLHKWIRDNKSLRNSGDKDAIAIYKEYGNIEMNSFINLTETQIDDILSFIKENPKEKKTNNDINSKVVEEVTEKQKFLIKILIFFLLIISIILIFILYRMFVLSTLLSGNNTNIVFHKIDFIIKFLYNTLVNKNTKNWYIIFSVISILLIFNIYFIWIFLMKIDVNKGYQPIQPIYFSHKIHSGINQIDCQYCHSSAKYSKVSGIPSLNVCMNCHITIDEYKGDYIEKGKTRNEYNQEIKKIYYAIGWDPIKRKYNKKVNPIKWVRIHNMPDFVYFDHSQHIITGGNIIKNKKQVDLVCNACHGDVKNMDQIYMKNDFTMEWCISCHKTIENDINNRYYKEYYNKKNINKKNTIDMIGATECAKCHY